jgi:hypothetical protein
LNELVTADLLNAHLRDNLNALKSPPTTTYELDQGSNYTTTSGSFTDVDGAGSELTLSVTISGTEVMVGFFGVVTADAGPKNVHFNVAVDGTNVAADDGIIGAQIQAASEKETVGFVRILKGLTPGARSFALRWKTNGATATLFAGAGSAQADHHPQFWVREVS